MMIKEVIYKSIKERDFYPTIMLIRNHLEQKKDCAPFAVEEVQWLSFNIMEVESILESHVASGIIYWLNKDPYCNAYMISKRLGVYHNSSRYWTNKLVQLDLVQKIPIIKGEGNEFKLSLNKKYLRLTEMILDLIKEQFGNNAYNIFHKNENKQWKTIKKWRENNPSKFKEKHNKYQRESRKNWK